MSARGEAKLEELELLRASDPDAFCAYCLRDSELVLRILAETGLDELTARRAALTGVSLELAWTSIPAFERVYGSELRARKVAHTGQSRPARFGGGGRHGARGEGRHVPPRPRLRLPEPLSLDHEDLQRGSPRLRAGAAGRPQADGHRRPERRALRADEGVLPGLIAEYAAEREKALAEGDEVAAYVYKILQNSFYGVLGAEGCRYARTEIAGAITSFGKKFLVTAQGLLRGQGQARALWRHRFGLRALGRRRRRGLRGLMAMGRAAEAEELNAEIARTA